MAHWFSLIEGQPPPHQYPLPDAGVWRTCKRTGGTLGQLVVMVTVMCMATAIIYQIMSQRVIYAEIKMANTSDNIRIILMELGRDIGIYRLTNFSRSHP